MDPWSWIGVGIAGTLVVLLPFWLQSRRGSAAARALDQLDTLTTWPPEPMKVLDIHERLAYQALSRAVPDQLLLASVPLAGFLNVPRRHSYTEWLKRVGHLSVDLMVCDRSSHVVAVVLLRKPNDSAKRLQRIERVARTCSAARIRVLLWTSGALPSPEAIREAIRAGARPGAERGTNGDERTAGANTDHGGLPLPLVVETHQPLGGSNGERETPPSTWFDELDPAAPPRRVPGGSG